MSPMDGTNRWLGNLEEGGVTAVALFALVFAFALLISFARVIRRRGSGRESQRRIDWSDGKPDA